MKFSRIIKFLMTTIEIAVKNEYSKIKCAHMRNIINFALICRGKRNLVNLKWHSQ